MTKRIRKIGVYLLLASILLLFGRCIQDDPKVFSLKAGDHLPDFKITDNQGNELSTALLRNKVSLIAFVNTECPDCRAQLPEIEKAFQQFNNNEQVSFIIISRNQGYKSLTEYWTDNYLTLPYSAQDDAFIFNKFASHNIPRTYISSPPEGIIRFTSDDSATATSERLIEQIINALSDQPLSSK